MKTSELSSIQNAVKNGATWQNLNEGQWYTPSEQSVDWLNAVVKAGAVVRLTPQLQVCKELEERIRQIACSMKWSDEADYYNCLAALTQLAEEERRDRELLIEFATNACGDLAENAARDLDHYGKNHSRWYKAVKRVRALLNIKIS